jgi:hypothetical protein
MSDKPALDALAAAKIAEVEEAMRARYGHALGEYFLYGIFDPILREIGYSGDEVSPNEFNGLDARLWFPRHTPTNTGGR